MEVDGNDDESKLPPRMRKRWLHGALEALQEALAHDGHADILMDDHSSLSDHAELEDGEIVDGGHTEVANHSVVPATESVQLTDKQAHVREKRRRLRRAKSLARVFGKHPGCTPLGDFSCPMSDCLRAFRFRGGVLDHLRSRHPGCLNLDKFSDADAELRTPKKFSDEEFFQRLQSYLVNDGCVLNTLR